MLHANPAPKVPTVQEILAELYGFDHDYSPDMPAEKFAELIKRLVAAPMAIRGMELDIRKACRGENAALLERKLAIYYDRVILTAQSFMSEKHPAFHAAGLALAGFAFQCNDDRVAVWRVLGLFDKNCRNIAESTEADKANRQQAIYHDEKAKNENDILNGRIDVLTAAVAKQAKQIIELKEIVATQTDQIERIIALMEGRADKTETPEAVVSSLATAARATAAAELTEPALKNDAEEKTSRVLSSVELSLQNNKRLLEAGDQYALRHDANIASVAFRFAASVAPTKDDAHEFYEWAHGYMSGLIRNHGLYTYREVMDGATPFCSDVKYPGATAFFKYSYNQTARRAMDDIDQLRAGGKNHTAWNLTIALISMDAETIVSFPGPGALHEAAKGGLAVRWKKLLQMDERMAHKAVADIGQKQQIEALQFPRLVAGVNALCQAIDALPGTTTSLGVMPTPQMNLNAYDFGEPRQ